jgi:hypothetical protein
VLVEAGLQVREAFGLQHEELTALAEAEPPGCGGVTWLPYMIGERTPCWPHASGALLGLRPGERPPWGIIPVVEWMRHATA